MSVGTVRRVHGNRHDGDRRFKGSGCRNVRAFSFASPRHSDVCNTASEPTAQRTPTTTHTHSSNGKDSDRESDRNRNRYTSQH